MSTSSTAPGDARAFAEELERYRIARGLTPAELARAVGASTSQVSRWRRGYGISLEHLEHVAAWMGRPLAELMVLAGYPAPLAILPRDDPHDPRFQALRSVWDRLDETRRQVIHEIALAGAALLAVLEVCKRPFVACLHRPRRAGDAPRMLYGPKPCAFCAQRAAVITCSVASGGNVGRHVPVHIGSV